MASGSAGANTKELEGAGWGGGLQGAGAGAAAGAFTSSASPSLTVVLTGAPYPSMEYVTRSYRAQMQRRVGETRENRDDEK